MEQLKLGSVETRFAEIIWREGPMSSGELVKRCQEVLDWKKSTTYTVLRKLCERGLLRNENSVVSAVMSEQEFYAAQSERFVEETFHGSLPAFFAAFTARKKLSEQDVAELQQLIDAYKGGAK